MTRTGDQVRAQIGQRVSKHRHGAAVLCLGAAMVSVPASAEPKLERFREADAPRISERVIQQGEWASELVFALGLSEALPEDHDETDLFSLLCAEQSEQTLASSGRMAPSGAPYRASATPEPGSRPGEFVRMVVNVPATALYALTVNGVGAQRWAIDQQTLGHLNASGLGVAQAPRVVPLRAGPHELSAYLVTDARVDRVELAAYRPLCIAPADGWRPLRPLTFAAKARTLVRTLGMERRLPIVGEPVRVEGERFETASAWGGQTNQNLDAEASAGSWAVAANSPAEFTYRVRLPEPGVYSLLARVHPKGEEIWSIDARYRVTVRPHSQTDGFEWAHVMTRHLDRGEHVVRALVPRDAGIDVLRFVRRDDSDASYLSVLRDAGFGEIGVPRQPVTQTAAYASLSNPLFAEISARLLQRLAGESPPAPTWVRELEAGESSFPASLPGL